jgi:hypothetical protein
MQPANRVSDMSACATIEKNMAHRPTTHCFACAASALSSVAVRLQLGSKESRKDPPKSKRTKAAAWGIRVLTEEEFFAEVAARMKQ